MREEVGELVHSVAHGGAWEEVEDRKACQVWVMRSKNKFLVREGVLKKGTGGKWHGRKLSNGGKCYMLTSAAVEAEDEVEWERKPEYAHMYYRGYMAGGREKEATCMLDEAKIYRMPLPLGKYDSNTWEFVRCRLVEEAVEEPVEGVAEAIRRFRRDTWL